MTQCVFPKLTCLHLFCMDAWRLYVHEEKKSFGSSFLCKVFSFKSSPLKVVVRQYIDIRLIDVCGLTISAEVGTCYSWSSRKDFFLKLTK